MLSRARRVTDGSIVESYDWGGVRGARASEAAASPATYGAPGAPSPAASSSSTPAAQATAQTAQQETAAPSALMERDVFAMAYAQGERAGAEAAAVRGEAMLRRLGETLQELTTLRAEMIRRTERQMVQLALAVAKRIVQREISLDRGLLVGMARAALDRLGEQASAEIRLHPDDIALVATQPSGEGLEQVRIVADPSVSRGGCRVHSDFGFMDVSAHSQFDELARALLDEEVAQPVAVPVRTMDAVAKDVVSS